MKILHLMLGNFYIDNYSYQENMLTKFHKKMGHDVEIIASLVTFDENGKATLLPEASKYQNENDIPVTRLNFKKPRKYYKRFRRFEGFREALEKAAPEIIFIHNCQFKDIDKVAKYARKNPHVKIYVDNHADYSNSAKNWLSKNVLHKIVWKSCAHKIEPYATKFYGVLPARVELLRNLYKLPKDKCELLVMGCDDELATVAGTPETRRSIREEYGIEEDDFLIITGGKIDPWKKQTLYLMDAVNQIDNPKIKLLVFGSVTVDLKEEINSRCSDKVKYLGWFNSNDTYPLFAASDLACFPGRHSVFWEQVAGQGIPMICKKWDGTQHVDLGGNVRFIENDSVSELVEEIERIYNDPSIYDAMKKVATEKGMVTFSYANIAKRSIDIFD